MPKSKIPLLFLILSLGVLLYPDVIRAQYKRPQSTLYLTNAVRDTGMLYADYVIQNIVRDTDIEGHPSPFQLPKRVNFQGARFEQNAEFTNIGFLADANFGGAEFNHLADFKSAKFECVANFTNCIFRDDALFDRTVFNQNAHFNNDSFLQNVAFDHVTISHMTDFNHCQFKGKASFTDLDIGEACSFHFYGATLPDTLDFGYNHRIPNEIDLMTIDISSRPPDKDGRHIRTLLFIHKSDLSKFRLNYDYFELLFTDPITYRPLLEEEKEVIYEGLLKNFRDHGQLESIKKLDIQYQQFKWQKAGWGWLSCLPRLWWNFGYDKELIFRNALILLLFFSSITCWRFPSLSGQVYRMENVPPSTKRFDWETQQFKEVWLKRIWYSFIYTVILFFGLTLKTANINYTRKAGTAYIILVYACGLINLGYIANFIFQR